MDRFEAMKIFSRVAELESFTKAAESLGLPKTTVSQSVRQLESLMGARLLHRTTRKVQLTQDGLSFLDRCKDLLADVEEVEAMFQANSDHVTGRLRVDMPIGIARNVLIPALPRFAEKHPGIEFEISSTDRKVDLMREGFDAVIRVGRVTEPGLIARPLGALTLINCASASYVKKHGKPKSLADLANHRLIHYTPVFGMKPDGFEYFDGERYRTLKMQGRVTVNGSDAFNAACLAGFGIIQAPAVGVRAQIKEGLLVEVLPSFRAEPMPVSLVSLHRRHLPRRVQLFMEWAREILRDYVS